MQRTTLVALVLALVLALTLTPAAFAHGDADEITVAAEEGDCASGTFCFVVTHGSFAQATPGEEVTVTLVNEGSSIHNLYVAPADQADPDHKDTPAEAAIASTDDLDEGESDTITFTMPEGGLYLWCEVPGHEQMGMWFVAEPGQADASSGDTAGNEAPMPMALALLALAGAALVLGRRS